MRRHREKAKESNFLTTDESPGFQNRTSKKCGTDEVRHALPVTPRKKAQTLKTVIQSPRTRKILEEEGLVKTPREENETKALKALAEDINEGLQHVKQSGSNENRAAFQAFKSLAFGSNVKKSRAKKCLSKPVNLNRKSIDHAIRRRENILKGEI